MAGAAAGSENRIYDNPVTLRQVVRPRPSSLSVEKRQFLRSASQDNANNRWDSDIFFRTNENLLFENIDI